MNPFLKEMLWSFGPIVAFAFLIVVVVFDEIMIPAIMVGVIWWLAGPWPSFCTAAVIILFYVIPDRLKSGNRRGYYYDPADDSYHYGRLPE